MGDHDNDFIDLAAFDDNLRLQEDGMSVEIFGPDNKPTGLSITVCGPDSSRAQAAAREIQKEIEQEAAKEGSVDIDSPEAQRRRQIAYLSKVTKGWNKAIGKDRLQFSEENAVAIYTKYPLIEAQVRFKADRRSSFIES